jgi:hypothetical protein
MGVSQSTVVNAQQHLAAVKRYPELGAADVSRREALRHHHQGHGQVECFQMNRAVSHTFVPSTQRAPAPPRA